MTKIFISGATGNIGFEVIKFLFETNTSNQIIAGVRDMEKAKRTFQFFPELEFVHFDFEAPNTFGNAFQGINRVFLLRPPHISDVEKYFTPLLKVLKKQQINQIIFLSVQGAEKSKVIPHNKIERLINTFDFESIFIRPSYFMQNLTTTLADNIKVKRKIILPAGKAKFNWIDIKNIAEVTSILIDRFPEFKNRKIELTGYENENFYRVTKLINQVISNPIVFKNVNLINFYRIKKKEGMVKGMIFVLLMLHFLPRFQKEPAISDFYEKLTSKKPTSLLSFITREKDKFE